MTQPGSREFRKNHHWTRVNTGRPSKITGIILDAATYQEQRELYDLGVTEEYESDDNGERKPSLLAVELPGLSPLPVGQFETEGGFFLSTAILDNISNLQVRRAGHRCLGLRVHHTDGKTEILGQWEPEDVTSISKVYDMSDGPLTSLTFHTTGIDDSLSRVSDITANVEGLRNSWSPTTPIPFRSQKFLCGYGRQVGISPLRDVPISDSRY